MRILIDHSGYHLRNLGDVAMLQGACRRIRATVPEAELHVIVSDPERLKRFVPEAIPVDHHLPESVASIRLFPIPHRVMPPALRRWVVAWERRRRILAPHKVVSKVMAGRVSEDAAAWLKLVRLCDAVVAVGGGYLNDVFPDHAQRVLEHLSIAQAIGKPTVFLGQGIGPLTEPWRAQCVYWVLGGARAVAVREPLLGPRLLKRQRIRNVRFTGDDALAMVDLSEGDPHQLGDAIALNIRLSGYAGVQEAHLATLKRGVSEVALNFDLPMRPLPIDSVKSPTDEEGAQHLIPQSHMDPGYQRPETPDDVIRSAAECRFVITGSYHAALFALAQGVPVVGIEASSYYAGKFDGLAAVYPGGVQRYRMNVTGDNVGLLNACRAADAVAMEAREVWRQTSRELKHEGLTYYRETLRGIMASDEQIRES